MPAAPERREPGPRARTRPHARAAVHCDGQELSQDSSGQEDSPTRAQAPARRVQGACTADSASCAEPGLQGRGNREAEALR